MVSALTAAACHDFDHDGFNNAYHVNFTTDRALRYHDKAVQENWHASESMKVLLDGDNNFTEAFSSDETKVLRKRIIGMILSTDMADHMSHINIIDNKVKRKGISNELNNGHLLIEDDDDKEKFKD
jgi:high affinity cGMP-specific 3',5'-cyclic phosphodiesterase 9